MGVKLVNEVLDHAPADWTQAERLFLAVLAEKARDETRRAWPGQATIARRTGLKGDSVTRMCHRLAAKGWELREQLGTDKNGKPVFARNGQAAVYAIPQLCPLGDHDPDVCFPAKGRTVVRAPRSGDAPSTVDISAESASLGSERPDGGPGAAAPESGQDPDGGPGISEKGRTVVRESPDGGPALTVNEPSNFNPQPDAATQPPVPSQRTTDSVIRWAVANAKSPKPRTTNPPHVGRQPALFTKTEVRLPQAVEIILNSLKTGHPQVTADDARAVHTAVRHRYGTRVTLNYLRTMAGNRSFDPFLAEIREARAEHVEAQIRQLQQTHADCEHGTAAGNQPHPVTGDLLCPWCRNGTQRPVDMQRERTHPAVAAAVTIYRQTINRNVGVAELLRFTQQATVLHRRGFTAEQLADHARQAAGTLTPAAAK